MEVVAENAHQKFSAPLKIFFIAALMDCNEFNTHQTRAYQQTPTTNLTTCLCTAHTWLTIFLYRC